ncbi:MAG: hypothetical protein QM727_15240 [Niabella sp.]
MALMFNELFTNSLKYAFENSNEKSISFVATREDNSFLIIYRDNGKGYSMDFLKQKTNGFGRIMLDGLAHQLHAGISFYNEGGACCMIKF